MIFVWYVSLFIILYTYAGYPIVIALLARFFGRPWQRASWPAAQPAPVSVILAVHNGAAILSAQLHHLLTLEPALIREVIVVSDGSKDGTDNILLKALLEPIPNAAGGPALQPDTRLKPILLPVQAGKCVALNHGIAAATGDILLFVDIRPRIQPGALASLLSNFADPSVGCVAGELLLTEDTHDATASAIGGLYWRYEQWIRNCEAAVDSPVGVYGGFYAVRRFLARPSPAGLILDDMFQPLSIIRQGYRSVLDRQALVTDRWPAKATGEFARKVRTLAGNFQLIAEAPWIVSPANRVLFQLLSHKLLRLVVPYCFVLLLLSSAALGAHSAFFAVFAVVQLIFWLMAAVAIERPVPVVQRLAAPASALLVLNAAAVVALYKFCFTPRPLWRSLWSPTPTSPS